MRPDSSKYLVMGASARFIGEAGNAAAWAKTWVEMETAEAAIRRLH
jgi:hypothetical protein